MTLGVLSILMALVLVLLFTDFPVPVDRAPTAKSNTRLGLGAAAFALASIGMMYYSAAEQPDAVWRGTRSALLCVAIVWLVEGFLRQPEKLPLLNDLEELRRDVVLEGVDPTVALRQVRVLVRGAKIEDVVHPQVLGCLRAIALATRELESACNELRALASFLEQAAGPLSDDENAVVVSISESHRRKLAAASDARRSAVQEYKNMRKRLRAIRKRRSELESIERVDAFLVERDKLIDQLERERRDLAAAVQGALAARASDSTGGQETDEDVHEES